MSCRVTMLACFRFFSRDTGWAREGDMKWAILFNKTWQHYTRGVKLNALASLICPPLYTVCGRKLAAVCCFKVCIATVQQKESSLILFIKFNTHACTDFFFMLLYTPTSLFPHKDFVFWVSDILCSFKFHSLLLFNEFPFTYFLWLAFPLDSLDIVNCSD